MTIKLEYANTVIAVVSAGLGALGLIISVALGIAQFNLSAKVAKQDDRQREIENHYHELEEWHQQEERRHDELEAEVWRADHAYREVEQADKERRDAAERDAAVPKLEFFLRSEQMDKQNYMCLSFGNSSKATVHITEVRLRITDEQLLQKLAIADPPPREGERFACPMKSSDGTTIHLDSGCWNRGPGYVSSGRVAIAIEPNKGNNILDSPRLLACVMASDAAGCLLGRWQRAQNGISGPALRKSSLDLPNHRGLRPVAAG